MKTTGLLLLALLLSGSIFGQEIESLEKDKLNIGELVTYFLHEVCSDRSGPKLFKKTITPNYIFLGGELPDSKFHIVNDFNIDYIDILGDSAICKVNVFVDKTLTIDNFYEGSLLPLIFKLKKDDLGAWKIDDQMNRGNNSYNGFQSVDLFDSDEFLYMHYMYEYFFDFELNKESYKINYLLYMRDALKSYYHYYYQYRISTLEKFSEKELQIIRNSIIAHYGRKFKTVWLNEYFNNRHWYSVNQDYDDSLLTENDLNNIRLIKEIEDLLY